MSKENYYLGLDIGTDSVGYAVTDTEYRLLRFKGEYMWGVHTFEAASNSVERRAFRVARRRLDRRQARVKIIEELFASEIIKVDPRFFVRLRESALFSADKSDGSPYALFNDSGYNDSHYYKKYPTIHHLISDIIENDKPHDIREIYLACIWLVAHRGHFLSEMSMENVSSEEGFLDAYHSFIAFFDANGYDRPWSDGIDTGALLDIMKRKAGVNSKKKALAGVLYGGKVPKDKAESESIDTIPFNREAIVALLAGGQIKNANKLFLAIEDDIDGVTLDLGMDDESFAANVAALGDNGELLVLMRKMRDSAALLELLGGKKMISKERVARYNRHKEDLAFLKAFIRKYLPKKYYEVFRAANSKVANYVAYSANYKSVKGKIESKKTARVEDFSDYIRKLVSSITPEEIDRAKYDDMMERLSLYTFMPKQVTGENRIIPYQLFRYELELLLERASAYLPFLNSVEDGLTVKEKIVATFMYRIPYFVGPLHQNDGQTAFWLKRRENGRIRPWNIEQKVDFDMTERSFIDNLTNTCTYLPTERVLPKDSLLYSKFNVLNEINKITVDQVPISVSVKQELFDSLFMRKKKVSLKDIRNFLTERGYCNPNSEIGGIDTTIKSSMKSYVDFRQLIEAGKITYEDAEVIIERTVYSENKQRLKAWIKREYPSLDEREITYVASLGYKEFGRLSCRLLTDIWGTAKDGCGEAFNIIDGLYNTNNNLMELLSDKYTFVDVIDEERAGFYSGKITLRDKLDTMYLSGAVKRPITRAMDIVDEIVHVMGKAPSRIFVEVTRSSDESKKGKRTSSRKQQLLDLYANIKTDESRALAKEIEQMGETAESRLRSDKLFLYYLQMGKSAYSGEPIELSSLLNDKIYDIDHIYPQHFIKDDSVLNNKVLVLSTENGAKSDSYPISPDIQVRMSGWWKYLYDCGFMTEEKYKRLTRKHGFTDEERWAFIERQVVETGQSTKAVAELLKWRFGDSSEVVYVKAGRVSDFRHEFGMLKSRMLNDHHHAKDAYLNIVVGNVYHCRFSRRWFKLSDAYSMKVERVFGYPVKLPTGEIVWHGEDNIALVKKYYGNDHVRMTRYAFCRHGGLFDQQPKMDGAIPRKAGLDVEKYGGYQKPTASFFTLVSFTVKGKKDAMIIAVDLMVSDRFLADETFRIEYVTKAITDITGKLPENLTFPLGKRIIKVNTVFDCDGIQMYLTGKSSGGSRVGLMLASQFMADPVHAEYIRIIEKTLEKIKTNSGYIIDRGHSILSEEKNIDLYEYYISKLSSYPYNLRPANPVEVIKVGRLAFEGLDINSQISCLAEIHKLFMKVSAKPNLTAIGGASQVGEVRLSSLLSNIKKTYKSLVIVDASSAGLFEQRTMNLLDLI